MTTTMTPQFLPTADNLYVISYPEHTSPESDFGALLAHSNHCEQSGEVEAACQLRYDAFKALMELIPDEDEVVLDWEDEATRMLLTLIRKTAIDHFLVGDFEMAAGMMEILLDLDPEDHTETTKSLAYCYIALGEYVFFDEIINDISDKYPEKEILKMWSEYRKTNSIPSGELFHFKRNFPFFYQEFIALDHPVSPHYLTDIEGDRPSKAALARELWLQTEHLWTQFPGFIDALRVA